MDSSSRIYVQEVINFLDSIVIKFTPFVEILNNKIEYTYVDGFDTYDPKTYPYYRILAGDVAFATTPIYGYSPNLREEILLTRTSVLSNKDVADFYREPNNLKLLLNRYPSDQFLIRRILNPVVNIDEAIAANNLTILKTEYDDTFLNPYEHDSLIVFLQDILWQIDYRWYMSPMEYEDQYPLAFYATLWGLLPLILLMKRILNIKTSDVHPYHVWQYLTSLGFGAYRGYLSREQELFLYRNALYLKFHAGKIFLLDILEKVFLTPLNYSLSKKTIIDHTLGREEYYDKMPDVVPAYGNSTEYLSSTNFKNFLKDIYNAGNDTRVDDVYLESVTDLFKRAPTNKLATKFLAFERNISISQLMLVIKFILDSTVYLISKDKLRFGVNITNPLSQNTMYFDTVTDALNLLFYCIYSDQKPERTFSKYTLTTAITHEQAPIIQDNIWIDGYDYYVKSYVDVDGFVNSIPYISSEIYSAKDLSSKLGDLYTHLFKMINKLASISDTIEYESHIAVFRTLVPEVTVLDIEQNYTNFPSYFNKYPEALIEFNKITTEDQKNEFIFAIFSGICSLDYGFSSLARDDKIISVLINKIKELFMYMVSYNITFINETFEQADVIELPKLTLHISPGIPGPDNVPTSTVGSLFNLLDEALFGTRDYTISVTENATTPIDLAKEDLILSCIQVLGTTPINIDPELNASDFITTSSNNTIMINSDGVELAILTN